MSRPPAIRLFPVSIVVLGTATACVYICICTHTLKSLQVGAILAASKVRKPWECFPWSLCELSESDAELKRLLRLGSTCFKSSWVSEGRRRSHEACVACVEVVLPGMSSPFQATRLIQMPLQDRQTPLLGRVPRRAVRADQLLSAAPASRFVSSRELSSRGGEKVLGAI